MAQQFINDVVLFYNPMGTVIPQLTSSVNYNGAPQTGGGTDVATYSMTANEVLSNILISVFNEFRVGYLRQTADEALIAEIEVDLGEINAALAALVTSMLSYDGTVKNGGTPPNPTYSMTSSEALNTILVAIWNEFTAVYTAITGITTGVSQSTLNTTLSKFVVDFVIGFAYTGAAGLTVSIASGTASIGGLYVSKTSGTQVLQPTKDNYLYLSNAGAYVLQTVTIGDPAPATPAGSIILWKFTTDGASVTANADQRNLFPFLASQISGLYAAGVIGLSQLKAEVTNQLVPVTVSTGKLLVSNGSAFVEKTDLTVDYTNHRLGINQSSPTATLHVGGSIIVGDDTTTNQGTITYSGGKFYGRNNSAKLILPQIVSDISDVTLTGIQANDTLYYNGSGWVNKQVGLSSVTTTAAVLYMVLPTETKLIADNSGGTVEIRLPDATTCAGRTFDISASSDAAIHAVTISTVAGNIRGTATLVLSALGQAAHLFSDGSNFYGVKV